MQTVAREPMNRVVTISDVLDLPPLIKPATAARILLVSEETVRNLIRSGEVPATKVGTRWRVQTMGFLEWAGLQDIAAEFQPVRRTGRERPRPRTRYTVDLSDLLARAHGGDGR